MADGYREFCQKQHRLIAHYLAVKAWHRGLDCIVLSRSNLEKLLGLERFKSTRIEWLVEDMKPWFPHQKRFTRTGSPSSIHSLCLSRLPLDKLPTGTMTMEKRIAIIPKGTLKVEALGDCPTIREVVTYLGILADGLGEPQQKFTVTVEKVAGK